MKCLTSSLTSKRFIRNTLFLVFFLTVCCLLLSQKFAADQVNLCSLVLTFSSNVLELYAAKLWEELDRCAKFDRNACFSSFAFIITQNLYALIIS